MFFRILLLFSLSLSCLFFLFLCGLFYVLYLYFRLITSLMKASYKCSSSFHMFFHLMYTCIFGIAYFLEKVNLTKKESTLFVNYYFIVHKKKNIMRVIKEDNKVRMENENKELGVFANIIFLFFNNLKNKFRILILFI